MCEGCSLCGSDEGVMCTLLAVDLTKVQCTTQSFSVHVDVILYKQNWEFKKVETEKKRLTNEPPLPLYRKKKHLTEATETNTCWSDRRPTGPTALLLVLHITTSQTIHYICTSFFCVSHGLGTRVPFPSRLIQFLLSVSFTYLLLLHHGRVPPSKVLHSHDRHSSYLWTFSQLLLTN